MIKIDVVGLLHDVMGSPWLYLAVFAFVAIDGFFPTIPGETLVVTAGVFAASGDPNLLVVVAVGALGGFAGDHVSYAIGYTAGGRLINRMRPGSRKRKPFDWASRALHERGGGVLIICRFVPGCRTAATLTTGSVRFPRASFALFTSIGVTCWATYFTLVGYVGGITFQRQPVLGVLLGIGLAVLVSGAIEGIRHLRSRDRRAQASEATSEPASESATSARD
ncbi:membrane protein DedA with SNARE-associated domain [Saccharopolyspora lacisalsi]|uniref:Membrane protein DedA with SNARE-associated domain n=1 Tax=Halosaccharopolyspora lacisalsi TaxID=1000566 RepID=A0A839DW90_9PSEU|nr:DedA family protein [Halosaccharopolyspora lacisalsi]MBA8823451.1 membrane protein DedA with SNARE-associated domain [Halosaccharopolyspora lacisalsi]